MDKPSVMSVIGPMLLKGGYTRQELRQAVAQARPDYKDTSAPVSCIFRALVRDGKYPSIKEVAREPREAKAPGTPRARSPKAVSDRWARFEARMAEIDAEVSAGFRRIQEYMAQPVAEPSPRRIWPA